MSERQKAGGNVSVAEQHEPSFGQAIARDT
jgi:hypothetical protein